MKLAAALIPFLCCYAKGQDATYKPGDFSDGNVLEDSERGTTLYLSNGLMAKAIAFDGEPVVSTDGSNTQLAAAYHVNADGGGTFAKTDGSGGYYYVSNSEVGEYPDELTGGAYSLEFNADHELVGYQQVLANTAGNCAGGPTPWNTWVSCEERREFGRCWQVDPTGTVAATPTNVTGILGTPEFGNWEAFAWDESSNTGYTTNDDYPDSSDSSLPAYRGAIVRFTPDATAEACLAASTDTEKWCALDSGTHDFLKLTPSADGSSGTFEWVTDVAQSNPETYAGSEGAHVEDGVLTFATILERHLFRLNLNDGTYVRSAVPFVQEPDNLRILDGTVYLCTDGDEKPGDAVWGWDSTGAYRVFYEENHNYPAGVDFSPDKTIMYVSLYGEATYQMWRDDGLAFDADTAGITYEVQGGIDDGTDHADILHIDDGFATSDNGGASDNGGTSDNGDKPEDSSGRVSAVAAAAVFAAGLIPLAAML